MRQSVAASLLCVIQACAGNPSVIEKTPAKQPVIKRIQTGAATELASINHASLAEISGIAMASTNQIAFWAINDSGNSNSLFAITHSGSILREFNVPAENRDWESISRANIDGQPYLIIGDTGDNLRLHASYKLHFIAEPLDVKERSSNTLAIERTITFRYPDGKHDVEAMTATGDSILFISKEPIRNGVRTAGKLYQLRLDSPQGITHVARYLGQMKPHSDSLASRLAASLAGIDLDQPTAMAVSELQQAVYVLTYRQVIRYDKQTDQNWSDALLGAGKVIHTHGLRQAEALSVADDGVIWFTSEKLPAPIWSIPIKPIYE